MQIVKYPHPALTHKSRELKRVDAELRKMIAEMFELMYAHKGIGLAANQVDLPYRVFVLNVSGEAANKDQELVFINPTILRQSGNVEAEEGCLSFPEIYAPGAAQRTRRRRGLRPLRQRAALRGGRHCSRGRCSTSTTTSTASSSSTASAPATWRTSATTFWSWRPSSTAPASGARSPDDQQIAARLSELERLRT